MGPSLQCWFASDSFLFSHGTSLALTSDSVVTLGSNKILHDIMMRLIYWKNQLVIQSQRTDRTGLFSLSCSLELENLHTNIKFYTYTSSPCSFLTDQEWQHHCRTVAALKIRTLQKKNVQGHPGGLGSNVPTMNHNIRGLRLVRDFCCMSFPISLILCHLSTVAIK